VTEQRVCPHCQRPVAAERIICPHCFRTLPAADAPAPAPSAEEGPAPVEGAMPEAPPAQAAYVPPPPPVAQPGVPYQPPAPQQAPYGPASGPPPPPPDDTLAIIGLVLSILGVVCCGCLPMLSTVGLILCIIAHTRRPGSLTWTGIVIGIIGTVIFVISIIASIYFSMHPEVYRELMDQAMKDLGLPPIPGLPFP